MNMTPKVRQQLKAQAHRLNPTVMIGNQGLTDAVKKEIDRALNDHELIKIKIAGQDRELRQQLVAEIVSAAQAELIQLIGHICVVYRKNPEKN